MNTTDYKRKLFAEQVRIWRARLNMTQRQYAERAKMSRRALQRAERGQSISLLTEQRIIMLAEELGVTNKPEPAHALG